MLHDHFIWHNILQVLLTTARYIWGWDSSVGLTTGYSRDSWWIVRAREFSLFHIVHTALKLITNLHLLQRSRSAELYLYSPICLFGVVLSRNSTDSIVTGYRLDGRGVRVRVPVGTWFFSSPLSSDRFCDQSASYPMGTWVITSEATGAWIWPLIFN
jgi:hypothetical protein